MIIAGCDPDSADALVLTGELSAALEGLTGSGGAGSFSNSDARLPRSVFVVARGDAGQLLGCAALRPLDGDVGEVKRMSMMTGEADLGP